MYMSMTAENNKKTLLPSYNLTFMRVIILNCSVIPVMCYHNHRHKLSYNYTWNIEFSQSLINLKSNGKFRNMAISFRLLLLLASTILSFISFEMWTSLKNGYHSSFTTKTTYYFLKAGLNYKKTIKIQVIGKVLQ